MSFRYAAISPSGQHRAIGDGDSLTLDGTQTVQPANFLSGGLRCYDLGTQGVAIWKGGDANGTAQFMQTGGQFPLTVRQLGPTYGNNSVAALAVADGLMLYWLSDGLTGKKCLLRPDGTLGTEQTWTPRPFASQGIRDVWPGEQFQWFDEQLYLQCGPYSLANWRTEPSIGRIIGAANSTPPLPAVGTYVWDGTDLWTVQLGDTPVPMQLCAGIAAISGPAADFIPEANWTRVTQPLPIPSMIDLTQKVEPVIFGAYLNPASDAVPSTCNCYIRRSDQLGVWLEGPHTKYRVIDLERGQKPDGLTGPFFYEGTFDNLMDAEIEPTEFDLLAVQCCPLKDEPPSDMQRRFDNYANELAWQYLDVPIGVIAYTRTNFVLSETDIANGLVACSRLQCHVVIFEANRPTKDVPVWTTDWLAYWRNGQPCPLQVVPPPPPTQPGLAVRKILLCRT